MERVLYALSCAACCALTLISMLCWVAVALGGGPLIGSSTVAVVLGTVLTGSAIALLVISVRQVARSVPRQLLGAPFAFMLLAIIAGGSAIVLMAPSLL